MRQYVINGRVLETNMNGLARYTVELAKSLDPLVDKDMDVSLLIPCDAKNVPELKNVKVISYGKRTGTIWEQTDLRQYIKAHKDAVCVNLGNVAPLFIRPGITAIHDIMYKVNPSHYTTVRNRISRYWHMIQYAYITRHEKCILTNSSFTQHEIERVYPKAKGKIHIVSCGWQHVLGYKESQDWENRYPFLAPNKYYFSLATLAKNKNTKWLIEAAKINPDCIFAIAGKYYETDKFEVPENVHLLGYISDDDACALIKNCKAFIHPSFYEGFGVPPLEALALGAEVICSNSTSMPEVLGDSVHYISPADWNVDIESLLKEPIGQRQKVLERYSWDKSASELLKVMKAF